MRFGIVYSLAACKLSHSTIRSSLQMAAVRDFSSALPAMDKFKTLLSGDDCLKIHGSEDVKFIDGSWYLAKTRDPRTEFISERIPGARYFDIESICDKSSSLPHMLPSPKQFEDDVSSLGISSSDHVVVYTKQDSFSAARIWWTFKAFGHQKVSILNGGLNAWKNTGGSIENGAMSEFPRGNYSAKLNDNMVVDWKQVLDIVNTGMAQIIDARSSARFHGTAPEPRPVLAGGHIPGSLNIPFSMMLKDDDVTSFKSPSEIRDIFVDAGVIFGAKTVLSCGSGVTAATLGLGLHLLGKELETFPIYDGSWSEWGGREDLPKTK